MGKSKRQNRTKDRVNPTAKPVKPPTDPELAAIREKQILPIITDLISSESKKRTSAAVAIANVIEDTKCRKLLLREQIVRILLEQTITDSALESKSAGWGILRNLALEEEADFCIHLYRQDILTAVQGVAKNLISTVESQDHPILKLPKAQQSLVWTLSDSVAGLVSSLADAQDEILEAVSRTPIIIDFIFTLLSFESLPGELFDGVLACLATLTEDNELLAKQIVDHGFWLQGLMQLREIGGPRAIAACGVLHNIFAALQWFDHNTPIGGSSDAILIPTLIQYVEEAQTKQDYANGSSHSSLEQAPQLALEIIASIATSLQEALEHSTHNEKEFEGFSDDNMVSSEVMMEGDGSEVGEEEDGNGDEEMNEEDMDADMELTAGPDAEERHDTIDNQPTLDSLIRIASPTVLSVARSSGSNDPIRVSALSALNNIAWTVSSVDFTRSCSSLSKLWESFAQRIWSEIVSPVLSSNTADIVLASSIASIAWALARGAQGKLKPGGDEQRKFMALYQASKSLSPTANGNKSDDSGRAGVDDSDDAFQSLGVKCIGVLGRLALNPAPVPLNREIGVFFITVLSALPNTPTADAVEALNQIFDIYADKGYPYDEPVFWADNFYQHLEAIVPKARKMAKSVDKRKYTELRLRADEAVLNLGRFLTYKRKEKASL